MTEATVAQSGGSCGALDGTTFREVLAYVRPKPEEVRWTAIPWQTDLWAARRLAAQHGKPIFLWAMASCM